MNERIAKSRARDITETTTIGTATDGQLFNELLRRCLCRCDGGPDGRAAVATIDYQMRDNLFEVGKMLIARGLKDTPVDYPL